MNRNIFLTDLKKLLTFMTPEERDETVRYYEELLNEAGPEKEDQMLAEFGSATKAAVTIFREYSQGNLPMARAKFEPDEEAEAEPEAETAEEPEAEPETETAEEPEAEPETEAAEEAEAEPEAETAEEPEAEPEAETAEEAEAEPEAEAAEEAEAEPEAEVAEEVEAELEVSEEPVPAPAAPKTAAEKKEPVFVEVPMPAQKLTPEMESPYVAADLPRYKMPGWAVALIMVLTCWLWIPVIAALFAVAVGLFAGLLGGGLGLVAGAAWLAICGIWALGVVPDALLMFGAAALLLAFGLVLAWFAVWLLLKLLKLLCRGIRGTYRGIFCRKAGKERA